MSTQTHKPSKCVPIQQSIHLTEPSASSQAMLQKYVPLPASQRLLRYRLLRPTSLLAKASTVFSGALAGGMLTALLSVSNAVAQEVEEVIIQATQTNEIALDDLVSSAVLDAEKLADAGIENVEDVAAYVPNLVLSETDTGTNIVIRGIGAGVNQGFDQSVGLFIDGVPLPRGQMARAPFLDLGGVQVLRGPQYVKDGNYSIAGSVHLLTSIAEDEFSAKVSAEYVPSQNDRKLTLTTGLPLLDWGSVRFAVQRQKSDGYVENVFRDEFGPQSDELLFRTVLALAPTENITVKLKVETGSFDSKGRQIEIIDSQATPDYRLFPEVIANGGRAPGGFSLSQGVASEFRNEWDYAVGPVRSLYDWPYLLSSVPAFAGRDYLQVLSDLYTDTGPVNSLDFGNGEIATVSSSGPLSPPRGLQDDRVDFKRAANDPEFSKNDTINYTANVDYWIDEHKLTLVASYIDYEVEELIDADFTPMPLLTTIQSENFKQRFYKFDYASPKSGAFEWEAGLMVSNYDLQFFEDFSIGVNRVKNQAEAELLLASPTQATTYISFDPAAPFNSYFGRVEPAYVRALELYTPSREFTQNAETQAAYLQTKMHFTDIFRATVGVRYTHSDKQAVRDFAFLLSDGSLLDVPDITRAKAQELRATQLMGTIFNFREHTSRINPDSDRTRLALPALGADPSKPNDGKRREEKLLPSITLEWDFNNDLSLRAAIRTANKLGGFDARSSSPPNTSPGFVIQPGTWEFEDEDATTYEIGGLWYLPNGLGQVNGTFFYTDFKNLQVSSADRSVGFNVRNAGAARTMGVELEGLLQLTDSFNLNYSVAWIDFEFTDYPLGNCTLGKRPDSFLVTAEDFLVAQNFSLGEIVPVIYENAVTDNTTLPIPGFGATPIRPDTFYPDGNYFSLQRYDYRNVFLPAFCDFNGNTNQYVAEWQGTFSFNYESYINGLGIFKPTLDVLYNSGYHTTTSLDPDVAQDRYVQLNGRIGLASQNETWEVALNIENITNEKIVLFANELPIATRIQASKSYYGFVRPPRSLGISFRYSFY